MRAPSSGATSTSRSSPTPGPSRSPRSPRTSSKSVLVHHQADGHAALLGVLFVRLAVQRAQTDRVHARHLGALLDEIAPHRLHPPLAEADVVGLRPGGIGIALQV